MFFLSLLHCKSDAFFFFFFFAGSNGVLGDCLLANFEIYIYTHRYIKKKISWKMSIFLSLISESETHILYRFFKPLFLEILMIMADRYWKTKIQSQKLEYYIRSIKKGYFKQKCQASEKYVHFYALNTWLGLLLHELLHQCGVAWRQSVCGTAPV